MKYLSLLPLLLMGLFSQAQDTGIKGQLQDESDGAVIFANVALYSSTDSSLVKVESSNELGIFQIVGIAPGNYFLKATYVGMPDLTQSNIELINDELLDLGVLTFTTTSTELEAVTVTAQRAMVEVKPDRTVFNVQGTINSVGSDAISLLRMAPGVTVDNNDNISVLGRNGVLLYVDGKRLPLTGQELSNFLSNLPAEQIDRIDIISNPGAKYEAEGNAGIIDIRLKRDKSHGANGSVSSTYSKGRHARYNLNGSGNFRNKRVNVFGNVGLYDNTFYNDMDFNSTQNGIQLVERNRGINEGDGYNFRAGLDYFIGKNQTVGVLLGGGNFNGNNTLNNRLTLAQESMPDQIDSVLVANNDDNRENDQYTVNLNYRFDNRKQSLNIDLDYGGYRNETRRIQPNSYFDATGQTLLTEIINFYDTPTDIDIYTFTVDYEQDLLGGRLSLGTKLSRVASDNSFLVYDRIGGEDTFNDSLSNIFNYDENVYAGYISYTKQLSKKWSLAVGLRAEQTDATGDLQAFRDDLQEPPVDLNYLSWFPNAGLTWQVAQMHSLAINYGRRINRPDYNVLNPFNNQLNQLSFEKGNPFLSPEIVNNFEIGYTYAYRYNFKLAYSKTTDQITRLIAPSDEDPRANFITWENLDEQTVISANISAPVEIKKWWNAYINVSASRLDNQARYPDGGVVDLQAFTYSFYQQHTFTLPKGFKGEISGYFAGPGIWGGVFEYESNWSLNLGLQRKFLQDQLNVRVSANDIFFQAGWDGVSRFNGLESFGSGRFDSRRVSLSLSYNFGNQNVKSRRRKTGMEAEAGRVSG
ncbi:MAG: TonB-dependent receptor [Bacteroidota bacterium]